MHGNGALVGPRYRAVCSGINYPGDTATLTIADSESLQFPSVPADSTFALQAKCGVPTASITYNRKDRWTKR